jgi:MYXO-CTERM domain-containing protein
MKHSFAIAALVTCVYVLTPHPVFAQATTDQTATAAPGMASPMESPSPLNSENPNATATPESSMTGAAAPASTSGGGSWGLLGLLGLLGLIGLRRRTP